MSQNIIKLIAKYPNSFELLENGKVFPFSLTKLDQMRME